MGRLAVRSLAGDGASVLCADLPAAVERCRGESDWGGVEFSSIDAFEIEALPAWFSEAVGQHGVPDAYIHLPTGSSRGKTLEELDPADLVNTFHSSLTSTFVAVRMVAGAMAARGSGAIVLFSSMYGLVSPDGSIYAGTDTPLKPNPLDYGVAKAGLVQMTKYCAMHYGRQGVRVNCLAPGPFPHAALQNTDSTFMERLAARTMLGRIGRQEDMIGPIRFLAGDDSSYMTGQCLVIDGGWTAW